LRRLTNLQHLRALAALVVVLGHVITETSVYADHQPGWLPAFPASFGVDIFFVISGFIMYYTTRAEWGRSGAAQAFMTRRLARIVPIYWILTAIEGLILFLSRLDEPARQLTPLQWIQSLAFIPYFDEAGKPRPILGVGWTLDYEMMFYTVFALSLIFRRKAGLLVLAGIFASLLALGPFVRGAAVQTWTRPIIVEFLIGVALGIWHAHGRKLGPLKVPPLLIAAGIVVFVSTCLPKLNDTQRVEWQPVVWLFAGLVVFVGLISAQSRDETLFGKAASALGDGSYSLYLSHPITVGIYLSVLQKTHISKLLPAWTFLLSALAIALGAAWLTYILIERPITRRLSRRIHRPLTAAARTA